MDLNISRGPANLKTLAYAAVATVEEFYSKIQNSKAEMMSINFYSMLDAHMNKIDPGWATRCAAAAADRDKVRAVKSEQIVATYGSRTTALAPCPKESLLIDATRVWRGNNDRSDWLDGLNYDALDGDNPAILHALRSAYAMPNELKSAFEEHIHWRKRDEELRILLSLNKSVTALDITAEKRWGMIQNLIEDKDHRSSDYEGFKMRYDYFEAVEGWPNEQLAIALLLDLKMLILQRKPDCVDADFKIDLVERKYKTRSSRS